MRKDVSLWDRIALAQAGYSRASWRRRSYPRGHLLRAPAWLGGRAWYSRRPWRFVLSALYYVAIVAVVVVLWKRAVPEWAAGYIILAAAVLILANAWFYFDRQLWVASRARTCDLDRLASAAVAGDPIAAADLRRDILLRREFWRKASDARLGDRVYGSLDRPAAVAFALGVCCMLTGAMLGGLPFGTKAPSLWWIGGFIGAVAYGATRMARVNRHLTRCLEREECPDCGYSLAAVTPAVPAANRVTSGPVRCPECGTPWPLAPGPFCHV